MKVLLRDKFPELAQEYVRSAGAPFETVTIGSGIKAIWRCSLDHEYEMSYRHRAYGHGCPYCSGNKVLPGFNDFASHYPDLVDSWSPDNPFSPEEVSYGSKKKVTWVCSNGHKRIYSCKEFAEKRPVCGQCKKEAAPKILVSDTPLSSEFSAKNKVDPSEISALSKDKVWWQCAEGHEWEATPKNRHLLNRGCPFCAGSKVIVGSTDFASRNPSLVPMWSHKNTLSPHEVSYSSEREILFSGSCGHEWKTTPSSISSNGRLTCPYCSGKKVLIGFNDLLTTHPHLSSEWSDENSLSITDVSAGSRFHAVWKCEEGHSYDMRVNDKTRTDIPRGCPVCSGSKGERDLYEWIKSSLPAEEIVHNSRSVIPPYEVDIYIPGKRVAVEFNGLYWHSENAGKHRDYHKDKWEKCAEQGIHLITVWEDDWLFKQDVVKSMLSTKLGFNSAEKISARKTVVDYQVSSVEAGDFLENNHIQGNKGGSIRLGLRHKQTNHLVALLVFSKRNAVGEFTLERFATSALVRGGFSKLLKAARQQFPMKKIITFADRSVSQGGLYEKSGFSVSELLPPDYSYVYGQRRVHKFLFRKKRFADDPGLLFEEGLSEKQLAELNKLPKVWDSGKIKYVLECD